MKVFDNLSLPHLLSTAASFVALVLCASQAQATTFTVNLTGDPANFGASQVYAFGLRFDEHYLQLSGLDTSNAITVSQGDQIDSTVTLASQYTIPTSVVRTDILEYLTGNTFPSENTGVSGTFTFFLAGNSVNVFNYSSSTSNQLASFAAVFPPNNGSFAFDSFTNDLTITNLPGAATLDGAAFNYALVTTAPELSTWAMLTLGFAGLGFAGRRQRRAVKRG